MRVVFASGIDEFCHRYGPLHWAEQLATRGVPVTVRAHSDGRLAADTETHDVLVLYRVPWSPWIAHLLDVARAHGARVVFAVDDLIVSPALTDIPSLRRASAEERVLWSDGVARYRHALETCDAFLATTAPLADVGRALGIPTFVHRAGLAARELALGARVSRAAAGLRPFRVGYFSGTATHADDLATIVPVLAEFLSRHATAELLLAGHVDVDPRLEAFGGRILRAPYVPWTELPAAIATVDVNLAPLEWRHPFVAAKGAIKYLEAAAVGVPVIASPIEAYRHVVAPGITGFLAADATEWTAALEDCVADPARLATMGRAARADVEARFAPIAQGTALAAILDEVTARRSPSAFPGPVTLGVGTARAPSNGSPAGADRATRRGRADDDALHPELFLADRFPGEVTRAARESADWPALVAAAVSGTTEPLGDGVVVAQSFVAAGTITRVDVWTVTYGQRLDHTLEMRLVDGDGRSLGVQTLPAALAPNGAWLAFEVGDAPPDAALAHASAPGAAGHARGAPARYALELRARDTGAGNALSFGTMPYAAAPATAPTANTVSSLTEAFTRDRRRADAALALRVFTDLAGAPRADGRRVGGDRVARGSAAEGERRDP